MANDILELFASIRTQSQRTAYGNKFAPNKPLLVLLMLSNLYNKGSSNTSWHEADNIVGKLLLDVYSKKNNVLDPFIRLRSDGLVKYSIDNYNKNVNPQMKGINNIINSENPVISFKDDIELFLLDNINFSKTVGVILNKFFSKSIYDLVLSDIDLPNYYILPKKSLAENKREKGFSKLITNKYKGVCLFCGFSGILNSKPVAIDAAHIKMHSKGGSSDLDNGLSLCTLCHRLFDRGACTLSDNYIILVSNKFKGTFRYKINDLIIIGTEKMKENISWHRNEIYCG